MELWREFWGKARPWGDVPFHPVVYHALDVAACVEAILKADPAREALLAGILGVSRAQARAVAVFCAAVHDLGKFSAPFQIKVPRHWPVCLGSPLSPSSLPHDDAGWLWWRGRGPQAPRSLEPLMRAAFGHHGEPPRDSDDFSALRLGTVFPPAALEAVEGFVQWSEAWIGEALPPGLPGGLGEDRAKEGSFLLAGVVTLGDWIGSSQGSFPYRGPDSTLEAYWTETRCRAEAAVAAAGLLPARATARLDIAALGIAETPTPLQAWASDVVLPEGPLLVVLEDLTGSGKTEAALVLAHRLMAAGRAQGLYMALPTQATANALFDRLARVMRVLFTPDRAPSLALTHGASALHPGFRAALGRLAPGRQGETGVQAAATATAAADVSAEAQCAAWIGEDRRLAFLADVGVGTLDQALLAVLPARHAGLRRWGLLGKVLILDEVHAYDAYMSEEINALIEAHAAQGGHTLVLSATLPQGKRRALEHAFQRGVGGSGESGRSAGGFGGAGRALQARFTAPAPAVAPGVPPLDSFPRAAVIGVGEGRAGEGRSSATAIAPWEPRVRCLPVTRVESVAAALDAVEAAARAGQAVLLMRNTVDEALSSHAALRDRGLAPWLFHARFALGDRQTLERRVMETFGRGSPPEGRRGRVLVATQVVEQSLDVDFDALITDLAPIDLLIQRAGRLWRHDRAERSGTPVLRVIAPERADPAAWVHALPPGTAAVYPDLGLLWRTAALLDSEGAFDLPGRARFLIEAVYGEGRHLERPDAVATAARKAEGAALAERSLARTQILPRHAGYCRTSGWEDDRRVMTRLGEPSVSVLLARQEGERPVWWCGGGEWRLSSVSVRLGRIGTDLDAAPTLRATLPEGERDTPIVVLRLADGGLWRGETLDGEGRRILVGYAEERGLFF